MNRFGNNRPCFNKQVTPNYAFLDRFEDNDQAVLELAVGLTMTVPRAWLPSNVQEGDVMRMRVTGSESGERSLLSFHIDAHETAERREAATNLRNSLPKGPEGDLEL